MSTQTNSQTTMSTWQKQLKQALRQSTSLNKTHGYSAAASKLFSPVITQQVKNLVDPSNPSTDPILAQFLPTVAETTATVGYQKDPVGDHPATQVPGLIHKYHGRVLLIASGSCAVNCRYCFRRHFPYSSSFAPRNQWQASLDYINNDPSIHEVILSGGDPLTLDTPNLQTLSNGLQKIPQIKTLRIHSRIPVVLSTRIDAEFLHWAQGLSLNKVMVLHINHSQELSAASRQAIKDLKAAGFVLLNQSVLLKKINDDARVLTELSHALFDSGVLPYYLHQMDAVQNAAHFTVPEATAIKIHQQLQAQLPGYLVPKLVQEESGMSQKTTLS